MIDAGKLSWPGVDRTRARYAIEALRRTVLAVVMADRRHGEGLSASAALVVATSQMRDARGYLGAIGFEKRGRL